MRFIAALLFSLLVSCGQPTPEPPVPAPPKTVRKTYRVISGVSMGAIGTAALGTSHPDRFDAIAPLGGPLDAAYVLRMMDRFHTSGTCPLESLEALLLQDPASLNDPNVIDDCAVKEPTLPHEMAADLNHWVWTPNGAFDRNGHLKLFQDLSLAYGNLFTENPASYVAPTGVPEARIRNPPADFCTAPVRVEGLHNREFNPEGKYDAITFCDGTRRIFYCLGDGAPVDFCSAPAHIASPLPAAQEEAFAQSYCSTRGGHAVATRQQQPLMFIDQGGRFDGCREAASPVRVGLAVDLNGNGRRDYGEPMLNNGQERFRDVGADGCANAFENGAGGCSETANPGAMDLNGDDYEAFLNPFGTENDWRWSAGEPFDDEGLDGVAGTGDFGEGNGSYDLTEGRRRLYSFDARTKIRELELSQLGRLRFLLDGGVRDLFNFGVAARQLFGAVRARHPGTSGDYRQWVDIPGLKLNSIGFDPWRGSWSKAPDNLFILYGTDTPTEQDLIDGEGDHVGTTKQALDRLSTLVTFAAAQWPDLPRPSGASGGASYNERAYVTSFDSAALGAKREFGVYLPPGYDLPQNAQVRYPVLYLLHGYGGDPKEFLGTSLIFDGHMSGEKPGLQPMIVIYPSGACCFTNALTGERDCREQDDLGRALSSLSEWRRECAEGSFYVAPGYENAFLELMDEVDQRFRTLPAEDVAVP